MQVLVFKVSKDSVVMDDARSRYVSFRTMDGIDAADFSRGTVMIKDHHWPIQKFSECWCKPSNIGMPIEVQEMSRIDTYIAVDPELEKFLSIKHTQEKELILDKLEKASKKNN